MITFKYFAFAQGFRGKKIPFSKAEDEKVVALLFSRFLYYAFEDESDFKNPFVSHRQIDYVDFFNRQGELVFKLFHRLKKLRQPVIFSIAPEQATVLTGQFNEMLRRSKLLMGNDLEANIKRLGLATFRIAMVLSGLRIADEEDISGTRVCSENDFSTAMKIASVLEKHANAVFKSLPGAGLRNRRLKFFEALPGRFDRKTYLSIGDELGIMEKNADKYIRTFRGELMEKEGHFYFKK